MGSGSLTKKTGSHLPDPKWPKRSGSRIPGVGIGPPLVFCSSSSEFPDVHFPAANRRPDAHSITILAAAAAEAAAFTVSEKAVFSVSGVFLARRSSGLACLTLGLQFRSLSIVERRNGLGFGRSLSK